MSIYSEIYREVSDLDLKKELATYLERKSAKLERDIQRARVGTYSPELWDLDVLKGEALFEELEKRKEPKQS